MTAPAVGTLVDYKLNAGDESVLAAQRGVGNRARAGDIYPAIVVRVFDPNATTANLQVFLDGPDTYWATSRTEGDSEGHWTPQAG